jgi:two-component system sensor histidine kinase GlrK
MIGYIAVFILMMVVAGYAILKLHDFNLEMRHILKIDTLLLEYEERLTESLLSQMRYERKFFITQDDDLYRQFLSAREDFENYLSKLDSLANSALQRDSIARIRDDFKQYHALIDEKAKRVKAKQRPVDRQFEEEKDRRVNAIIEELEHLEAQSHDGIRQKMKALGGAGLATRRLAIILSSIAVSLFIAISYFTTRSIARPLSLVTEKANEISGGVFQCDLDIPSPPEISEVARAFNAMCDRLKMVDKMKSDFLSMMSHELRTPLTSIKEGTALLREEVAGPITEKQKRLLTIIKEESNRLIDQVNSLLDVSKMEAGMMTFHFERGSLPPLIEMVTLEMGPIVESKKINLDLKMDEPLPEIPMDREKILQALRNLVGNAVKFTPEGGRVVVSARLVDREVEVSVTDTGPGIPRASLATVFDKFLQIAPAGSTQARGTGLGLAIAKYIITSHGGKIWAKSELGQGSTFTFLLPA